MKNIFLIETQTVYKVPEKLCKLLRVKLDEYKSNPTTQADYEIDLIKDEIAKCKIVCFVDIGLD